MIILKIWMDPVSLNGILMKIIDEELIFGEINEVILEIYHSESRFDFKIENILPLSRIVYSYEDF
jgi:hypothetical protein